ncbi:hypothetical protein JDS99_29290 [Bacillus cereus group sp. N6]|uniref:hypothetical protein n=1 Tax=Bacillus cereus group sp. N6 TaxID=2794583 RepID=UPI0018F40207|nr:hypothetical protein [Bacillus cereus group sp. N6]MBJ8113631.1 hypothetical protein [Bacillus cereus group sp. N6]
MKWNKYAITFGKIGNIIGGIYALYRWLALQLPVGSERLIFLPENIFNIFPIVLAGIGLTGYSLYKLFPQSFFFIWSISMTNALFLIGHEVYLARMSAITVNDKIGYLIAQYLFDTLPCIYVIFIALSGIFLYHPKLNKSAKSI